MTKKKYKVPSIAQNMPQVKSSYTADGVKICTPLQKSFGPYL